jgi:hypothetical protein
LKNFLRRHQEISVKTPEVLHSQKRGVSLLNQHLSIFKSSKRRKRVVCRDSTPSDTPSDSDPDLTVPFADNSTEEKEQDADCVLCTGRFPEDHNVEEWIQCAKCFRWAHTLCVGMEEDFVCRPCQG